MSSQKKPKESKIKRLMLSQTAEQREVTGDEIERTLRENQRVKTTIKHFLKKYGNQFNNKLGLTEDDLMSEVRQEIWKGMLTWKKAGKANVSTYLNALISYRFQELLDMSLAKKRRVDYYADVFRSVSIDPQQTETHDTGESLFEHRQEIMSDCNALDNPAEQEIYLDLLTGFSIAEMMSRHSLTRVEVVAAVKAINARVMERRVNTAKGAL